MKADWIICSQLIKDLRQYPRSVVWVNKCVHCGKEEPVYPGPLHEAILKTKKFIQVHRRCEATSKPCLTCGKPNDQWQAYDECWECRIDESW